MLTTVVSGFEVVESVGDGRGETHVAYFNNAEAAKMLASKSPCWMRVQRFEKVFDICSTVDEYTTLKTAEVKARALAKLSPEELVALGL